MKSGAAVEWEKRFVKARERGQSADEIARAHGVTRPTVLMWMRRRAKRNMSTLSPPALHKPEGQSGAGSELPPMVRVDRKEETAALDSAVVVSVGQARISLSHPSQVPLVTALVATLARASRL